MRSYSRVPSHRRRSHAAPASMASASRSCSVTTRSCCSLTRRSRSAMARAEGGGSSGWRPPRRMQLQRSSPCSRPLPPLWELSCLCWAASLGVLCSASATSQSSGRSCLLSLSRWHSLPTAGSSRLSRASRVSAVRGAPWCPPPTCGRPPPRRAPPTAPSAASASSSVSSSSASRSPGRRCRRWAGWGCPTGGGGSTVAQAWRSRLGCYGSMTDSPRRSPAASAASAANGSSCVPAQHTAHGRRRCSRAALCSSTLATHWSSSPPYLRSPTVSPSPSLATFSEHASSSMPPSTQRSQGSCSISSPCWRIYSSRPRGAGSNRRRRSARSSPRRPPLGSARSGHLGRRTMQCCATLMAVPWSHSARLSAAFPSAASGLNCHPSGAGSHGCGARRAPPGPRPLTPSASHSSGLVTARSPPPPPACTAAARRGGSLGCLQMRGAVGCCGCDCARSLRRRLCLAAPHSRSVPCQPPSTP